MADKIRRQQTFPQIWLQPLRYQNRNIYELHKYYSRWGEETIYYIMFGFFCTIPMRWKPQSMYSKKTMFYHSFVRSSIIHRGRYFRSDENIGSSSEAALFMLENFLWNICCKKLFCIFNFFPIFFAYLWFWKFNRQKYVSSWPTSKKFE